MFPTEQDFANVFDSYVHKDDGVSMEAVVTADGGKNLHELLLEYKQELLNDVSQRYPMSEGTREYWDTHWDYVPRKGELVVYTDYAETENGEGIPGFKWGDGMAYVADLPFSGTDDLLKRHISDKSIHHTVEMSVSDKECLIIQ